MSLTQGPQSNTGRSEATNLRRLRLFGLAGVEVLGYTDASKPADAKAFRRGLGRDSGWAAGIRRSVEIL